MYNSKKKTDYLRKWPYPYTAAISISSDFDFTNFDFFEVFMRFLRTSEATELGFGLNLDITSSMFFYGNPEYTASYFAGLECESPRSKHAGIFDEFLKEGVIDANHSFGDFNHYGGFSRKHADRVYKRLADLGVQLKVFINHGDALNCQNIGTGYSHHKGCDSSSKFFHTNLFSKNGVKYVWSQNLLLESIEKKDYKKNNLVSCILQDGQEFKGFYRFRGTGVYAPNLSSLAQQINSIDFDQLYKEQGYFILYQHLGVLFRHASKSYSATIEDFKKRPELLYPFYQLKTEKEKGKLLILGLAKFLNYIDTYSKIKINKEPYVVNTFFILGDFEENHEFSGLTFYIDPTTPVHIYFKDKKLKYYINGPDETDRYSATLL